MKIRVYYEDTDSGGVVYHTNYIKYCERARSEMFFSKNIIFDENGYFVVSKLDANFIKPAKLGDIIEVRTEIKTIKRASIVLEQTIYKDDMKIFVANITVAFIVKDKLTKIPQEMLSIFT
ncbi:MAG: YbgC/FadM family acyl-CoA thioesterase [Arcobacteraceae bacterium]|nr:YbgC/FadM family acyl-CoA thioesterase [Arcobacteraceae bacterium]